MRSNRKRYRAHAWPEVTSPEVTWLSPYFFPSIFSRTFPPQFLFSYLFPRTFISPYFSLNFFCRTFSLNFFSVLFSSHFFKLFFSPYFFTFFFPVLFQIIFIPYFFFRKFVFLVLFFPVLFSRTFSNVTTFEIQRFKISVSCFSRTCRYNTVHVPCGISIQTSPIGLPWKGGVRGCAIWRDQKWIYLT